MRIEDYALLGNFHSAALVSREGSIDWLCLPRFDSPACFAALLGSAGNGRWLLRPESFVRVTRKYREGTLVLETDYECEGGSVRVTDAMISGADVPTLIRLVRGTGGRVKMTMELVLRFDYGSIIPWVTADAWGGMKAIAGPDTVRLNTTAYLLGEDLKTYANFSIHEGETVPFVMTWTPSHADSPRVVEQPAEAIERTAAFWCDWSARCPYDGPYRAAVQRSLITLKALTYERTGGLVAAPTTSLPETIGGVRNWDYRYCWIRDATITLYALLQAGYREEARRWQEWLLAAVAGTPDQVNIMYGLRGERRLTEFEIPWLTGYEESGPVRIGNAAHSQFQLDVFGELLLTFCMARRSGLGGARSWSMEVLLAKFVAGHWQEPDSGIWEVRGPRQHFTHSKVMAWLAMDSAVRTAEEFGKEGPVAEWKAVAAKIHAEVCERGFSRERGAFVQAYGSRTLDASLLMIPQVGFLPATDPRMVGTVEAIRKELMEDGFVYRYAVEQTEDGLSGKEGTFIPCTFWLAENLHLMGRVEEARNVFEGVLAISNDLGLLAEEYDVGAKRMVGNFPQAFSHVGLINAAYVLNPQKGS